MQSSLYIVMDNSPFFDHAFNDTKPKCDFIVQNSLFATILKIKVL